MTVQSLIAGALAVLLALVVLTAAGLVAGAADDTSIPPFEYTRPSHRALLRGEACIPVSELLKNRAIPAIHSYSRSIAC